MTDRPRYDPATHSRQGIPWAEQGDYSLEGWAADHPVVEAVVGRSTRIETEAAEALESVLENVDVETAVVEALYAAGFEIRRCDLPPPFRAYIDESWCRGDVGMALISRDPHELGGPREPGHTPILEVEVRPARRL